MSDHLKYYVEGIICSIMMEDYFKVLVFVYILTLKKGSKYAAHFNAPADTIMFTLNIL